MKSIRNQRRMSLRPPRAFPIDFIEEINRKSKENEPVASKDILLQVRYHRRYVLFDFLFVADRQTLGSRWPKCEQSQIFTARG